MIGVKYDEHHEYVKSQNERGPAVKVSREQMEGNRQRILAEASRLFKDKGFDQVSVAEVMQAAGLTHGGFYGHFSAKSDLIAQTLEHALAGDSGVDRGFDAYLESYLAPRHRDRAATGCPTAALASDTRHQPAEARAAMAEGLRAQIDRITNALSDQGVQDPRQAAIGAWSAMVGAMIIARSVDDPALSDEILLQTRDWIAETQQP